MTVPSFILLDAGISAYSACPTELHLQFDLRYSSIFLQESNRQEENRDVDFGQCGRGLAGDARHARSSDGACVHAWMPRRTRTMHAD